MYIVTACCAACVTALLNELGRRISVVTGDARERSFPYQRLSVTIQR